MPIYEYRCEHCGAMVEVFGQTAEQAGPPTQCHCGESGNYTRLYSRFAAVATDSHSGSDVSCEDSGACELPGSCCCGHSHCSHGS